MATSSGGCAGPSDARWRGCGPPALAACCLPHSIAEGRAVSVLELPTPEIPTPDPRSFDETSRPFAEAVAGQYAIKRMIGRGGMGIVYLARDRRLDRLVAIKTLPPQLAGDPTVRERFVRETRTAGGMSHPNIVPVHGADEIGGHVFFVMGYVDGESLAAHVRAHGRLPARAVAGHLRDV